MPIIRMNHLAKRRGVARSRRLPGNMTKAEIAYVGSLESQLRTRDIIGWRYEAVKLRLADNTFFTADFLVQSLDNHLEFHEVKACYKRKDGTYTYWAEEDAKLKIKFAAEEFHEFKFVIAYQLPAKAGGLWRQEWIGQEVEA